LSSPTGVELEEANPNYGKKKFNFFYYINQVITVKKIEFFFAIIEFDVEMNSYEYTAQIYRLDLEIQQLHSQIVICNRALDRLYRRKELEEAAEADKELRELEATLSAKRSELRVIAIWGPNP